MQQERGRKLADEAASVILGSRSNLAWQRRACRSIAAAGAFLMVGILVTACSDWFQPPPAPSPRPLPTPTSTLSLPPIQTSTPAPALRVTATPGSTPLSTPAPTRASTPALTAEDLLIAQLSAVIEWFGEPPDPIHLEAREAIIEIWLRDAELGEFITQAPWVVDGIADAELEALDALNILSAIDSELVESIFTLPWVANGVDYQEQSAFEGLLKIGWDSANLLRAVVFYPWVAEAPGQTEASLGDVFDRLHIISSIDKVLAVRLASVPWIVDGVNPTELVLLSVLPNHMEFQSSDTSANRRNLELVDMVGELNDSWIQQAPDPRILDGIVHLLPEAQYWDISDQIKSEPWFRDGLDATEAARAAIFMTTVSGRSLYRERSDSPLVPSMTISLPLAGDIRVWLVGADRASTSEDSMLAVVEESARFSEELLGTPFPTTDIIIDILDPDPNYYSVSCTFYETHIWWSEFCPIESLAQG